MGSPTSWYKLLRLGTLLAVVLLSLGLGPLARAGEIVPPEPGASWQYQLSGTLDLDVEADVFDIDGFETRTAQVAELHARGRYTICYISAGAWERWRPDASDFPERLLGRSNGWPGERWLDIRRLHALKPILRARLDMCDRKGFDAVEFDNVDGFDNRSGWPLKWKHQLRFNRFLASAAHHRGLAAGLKNDLRQIPALVDNFDFAINEQCWQYRECGKLKPFTSAGKAVFNVEYRLERSRFCDKSLQRGFGSIRKRFSLRAWIRACEPDG
jgi:hypothetical protein